jgi:hypothetical protein
MKDIENNATKKSVLFLFDVDGTITEARKVFISNKTLNFNFCQIYVENLIGDARIHEWFEGAGRHRCCWWLPRATHF